MREITRDVSVSSRRRRISTLRDNSDAAPQAETAVTLRQIRTLNRQQLIKTSLGRSRTSQDGSMDVSDVLMAPTTAATVIVHDISHVGAKKHGQCLPI